MFKGDAGPNVIRPTGRPKQGTYSKKKGQMDLFDKKGNNSIIFKSLD